MSDAASSVSIIIPTQRRLEPLTLAALSALGQIGVDETAVELVVVDNDVEPSARELVENLACGAPFPVIYVHEPRAGVANARNAALEQARGDFIAFLDDDEEAPSYWLLRLLETQRRFDADVVFGPVRGRAPAGLVKHRSYLERFFSREGPAEAGLIDEAYGCGDSLVRRASLPDPRRPFSAERNQTGGEDDLLFSTMKARGARFAWAPEAYVWEDPAADRLNLRYAILRAFAYGQGPSKKSATASPPDRLGVARWMAIGAGQALVYGLIALVKGVVRAPDWAFAVDRAARGLGKVLWWRAFAVRFYGRVASDAGEAVRGAAGLGA
ncbi:MAG: glycosyltransferase family 2 protein [Caulobacteraceae bacterium]|nr:glycosyltransferase family 2 protein [Caulobacteraceae bacterium]